MGYETKIQQSPKHIMLCDNVTSQSSSEAWLHLTHLVRPVKLLAPGWLLQVGNDYIRHVDKILFSLD